MISIEELFIICDRSIGTWTLEPRLYFFFFFLLTLYAKFLSTNNCLFSAHFSQNIPFCPPTALIYFFSFFSYTSVSPACVFVCARVCVAPCRLLRERRCVRLFGSMLPIMLLRYSNIGHDFESRIRATTTRTTRTKTIKTKQNTTYSSSKRALTTPCKCSIVDMTMPCNRFQYIGLLKCYIYITSDLCFLATLIPIKITYNYKLEETNCICNI